MTVQQQVDPGRKYSKSFEVTKVEESTPIVTNDEIVQVVGVKEDDESKKSLTLFNGVTMSVGCIIGSGIFVSPTGVHDKAGSVGLSLLVWFFSGVFIAIGAYCYAELGTLIKKSGGDYAYILEAFGPFAGFVRLWIEAFVVRPCTVTIIALTFAIYVLRPIYPTSEPPEVAKIMIATLLITFITAINAMSVRAATALQDIVTIAKVVALGLIVCTGLGLLATGESRYYDSFENIFAGSATNVKDISLAFYSGLFAYSGWNYLNFIVDELQNPKRNLPLAIAISISMCTLIHVLTLVAFYTAISPDEMLDSPAVAVTFANKVFGPLSFLMPIFVAISTFGSANGVIYTSARLFYSGAKEGQMPMVLTMSNRNTQTPIPAVLLTGLLSLVYLFVSKDVYALINYIQISYWLAIAGAIAALFYFRRSMPHASRPIKVSLVWPAFFFAGCVFLIFIPILADFHTTAIGIGIMCTALPVYMIFIAWKRKPAVFDKFTASLTLFLQKLCMVAEEKQE